MPPNVSVIMSVHNEERYIAATIESILNQSYSNFEFLIIDDGSTDNTKYIIEDYMKRDNRIIYIYQNHLGLTIALNHGLWVARGEYVARQDSGDISDPSRLQKQLAFLREHPEISVCFSWVEVMNLKYEKIGELIFSGNPKIIQRRLRRGSNIFVHGSVMFRKEEILRVGGYDENMKAAQDFDLWLHLIKQKRKLGAVQEFLYKWRLNLTSISFRKELKQSYWHNLALEKFNNKPIRPFQKKYRSAITTYEKSNNPQNRLHRYYLNLYLRTCNRKAFLYSFKYLLNQKCIGLCDIIKLFLIFSPIDYRYLFKFF